MQIRTPRENHPTDTTLSLWAARQRSGIPSVLFHIIICIFGAALTFVLANAGGLWFVAGASITLIAIGLLIRRATIAGGQLFQLVSQRLRLG